MVASTRGGSSKLGEPGESGHKLYTSSKPDERGRGEQDSVNCRELLGIKIVCIQHRIFFLLSSRVGLVIRYVAYSISSEPLPHYSQVQQLQCRLHI